MSDSSATSNVAKDDSTPSAGPTEKKNDQTNAAASTSKATPTQAAKEASPSDDTPKKEEGEGEATGKRFIPQHKKADAALTFPEKLMNMMKFAQKQEEDTFCVAWLPDGQSFVIRNPDEFTRQVLPKFFKATKFSSFTRKLYRWGFRQVNRGIGPDDPIIFGNEFFQRDDLELMAKMRSITAASTRRQEANSIQLLAQKRALESMDSMVERDHKRALFDQLMQQKAAMNQGMFGNPNAAGGGMNPMNFSNALRPGLGNNGFNSMGGPKPFDMLQQQMQQQNPLISQFQMQQSNNFNGMPNNVPNPHYPSAASTAEIVNAAINALRYAP